VAAAESCGHTSPASWDRGSQASNWPAASGHSRRAQEAGTSPSANAGGSWLVLDGNSLPRPAGGALRSSTSSAGPSVLPWGQGVSLRSRTFSAGDSPGRSRRRGWSREPGGGSVLNLLEGLVPRPSTDPAGARRRGAQRTGKRLGEGGIARTPVGLEVEAAGSG
jgi:hypothetical protein